MKKLTQKKVSTVLLDWTYIGINLDCTNDRRVSVRTHELKHVLFDRKNGSSTQVFQDTYFYSLYNSKAEQWANTFDTELLLANDAILKPIDYYEYARSFCKSSSTLSPIWLHWMRLPNCNVTKSKIWPCCFRYEQRRMTDWPPHCVYYTHNKAFLIFDINYIPRL